MQYTRAIAALLTLSLIGAGCSSQPTQPTAYTPSVDLPPPAPATSTPPTQIPLYNSPKRDFQVGYPDEFAIIRNAPDAYSWLNNSIVAFAGPKSWNTDTNLLETYAIVSSSSTRQAISDCLKPIRAGGEPTVTRETVSGINYTRERFTGAAAGNTYDSDVYRTVHNNTCYEISLMTHSGNVGNYEPGSVKEFGAKTVSAELHKIVEGFKFTK